VKQETLERLLADRAAKRPVVLATNLDTGEEQLLHPDNDAWSEGARRALMTDQSQIVETDQGRIFLNVFNPPLRLAIIGAVHIAQPLARMASVAGYDVTIIDPRRAFATQERFPGLTLLNDWPDDAMRQLRPDRRTAVVALTHDPKIDDPGLTEALKSDAFYIGALGSRKTHAGRLARLRERGFNEATLSRIHGPVGLDIGARSPAEIAVAVLAQMTERLRRGDADSVDPSKRAFAKEATA
jgi:xanthine dehydrogenase accessory factor